MLAGFVLTFLCLNVAGVLCLAFCFQLTTGVSVDADAHLSEHCRQMKRQAEEKNRDSSRITADEVSCCMLPVAMFAGPVEPKSEFVSVPTAEAGTVRVIHFAAPVVSTDRSPVIPVYRPPPIDRRPERILHSVIRI